MEANTKAIIIDFSLVHKLLSKPMEDAYEWAKNEQRRCVSVSEMANLSFDSDWYNVKSRNCYVRDGFIVESKDECIFSLFISEEEQRVILRLDWPRRMLFKYYDVMNYDVIRKIAPRSVMAMKNNALRLSQDFKCSGGIYRYMDWD